MLRPPPSSTLFPYTTLFRSAPPRPAVPSGTPCCARPAPPARGTADRGRGRDRPARRHGRATRRGAGPRRRPRPRSEEHTSELQSQFHLVCRLLLEKKNIQDG